MRDWLINLPSELTETDLIEMVEGTLPAHREPIAIAALKAEPRLGLLIKQLRADREAAGSLAKSATAPADVGERVLGVVDRRMIRELDEIARQQVEHIPVSTLTIHEPTALELIMQSAWTKRLAIAAGLLIAAGVGYLGIRSAMTSSSSDPLGKGPIATNTTTAPASVPAPAPRDVEVPSTAVSAAVAPERSGTPAETIPAPTPAPSDVAAADTKPAPEALPDVARITPAIAARLAREGRLAIVLYTANVDEVTRRAQALSKASPVAGAVVCRTLAQDKVPAQALALVTPDRSTPANPSAPATDTGVAQASKGPDESAPDMSLSAVAPDRTAEPAPLASIPRAPAPAFLATLDPSERTLAAVRLFLETGGETESKAESKGGVHRLRAEFRVMDAPIAQTISLDPESILWWNAPASRWARLSSVPIVIDQSAP